MERTWKATVGGILAIVGGAAGVAGSGILMTLGAIGRRASEAGWTARPQVIPFALPFGLFRMLAASHMIFGILAIIGGILTLQRRYWGWALAGAIASIFACLPLGVAALILVALSEKEFSKTAPAGTP